MATVTQCVVALPSIHSYIQVGHSEGSVVCTLPYETSFCTVRQVIC